MFKARRCLKAISSQTFVINVNNVDADISQYRYNYKSLVKSSAEYLYLSYHTSKSSVTAGE